MRHNGNWEGSACCRPKFLGRRHAIPPHAKIDARRHNAYAVHSIMSELQNSLLELIRRTSAEIPDDVNQSILASLEQEKKGTIAESALKIIDQNIQLAKRKSQPICQDTGSILFYVDVPVGYDQITFEETAQGSREAGDEKRISPPELGGFTHGQERRHKRRARRAGVSFSSTSFTGSQRATRAQGRRLRKRRRTILAAE